MKRLILSILLMSAAAGAQAQEGGKDTGKGAGTRPPQEDELYYQGQDAMNESRWADALDRFSQVVGLKGSRAEAATYWKAVSLRKLGSTQQALATISDLLREHRDGRYAKDALALQLEIQGPKVGDREGATVQVSPSPTADCNVSTEEQELKLLALNGLMDRDEDRAVSLLDKFLQRNPCKRLRERALFVLGQSSRPEARALLGRIARGQLYPELQLPAIHEIGVVDANEQNEALLSQIYGDAGTRQEVKVAILDALGVSGARASLVRLARLEKDLALQRAAIHGLGVAGARAELRALYKGLAGSEAKASVLDAFVVADDAEGFTEIARTETDSRLRHKAIEGIGICGGPRARPALLELYGRASGHEEKEAVLQALMVADDARALVDLARAEKDARLRRSIVEKLSNMDSEDARKFMLEILDK
jgi:outer membrane protein assembly factor BamD (BamD/ComL family)